MTDAERLKYNEYQRNWHRKHPGKATEYTMRYFARKLKEMEEKANEETNEKTKEN